MVVHCLPAGKSFTQNNLIDTLPETDQKKPVNSPAPQPQERVTSKAQFIYLFIYLFKLKGG